MPTETEIRDGRLQALQSRDDEIKRLRLALDDIANGRLAVTDAMLVNKETMQTAIAEYSQKRAREALAPSCL